MQAAYVLCRLFKKSEETTDVSKYDEPEATSLSPTTNKSSPDNTSLHNVQTDGTETWLTDTAHNMTHNPVPSFENQVSDLHKSTEKEPIEQVSLVLNITLLLRALEVVKRVGQIGVDHFIIPGKIVIEPACYHFFCSF